MPTFPTASPYAFRCGLATVALPADWELVEESCFQARFRLMDGGHVSLKAMCYEQPEAIARAAYEEFVWDMISREDFETLKSGLQQWWEAGDGYSVAISARDVSDDGTYYRNVWRNLSVRRPDVVRKIDWTFEPASRADGAALAEFGEALNGLVHKTRFAEGETELDRIAPSETLKLAWIGDGVLMRMPFDWKVERENPDGTGRYVVDEPDGRDRWSLWVDWEEFEKDPDTPDSAEAAAERTRQYLLELPSATSRPGPDGTPVIVTEETVDERDKLVRITTWHRVAARDQSFLMAHFTFVAGADVADVPDVASARALVGREAANAVLVPSHWTLRQR